MAQIFGGFFLIRFFSNENPVSLKIWDLLEKMLGIIVRDILSNGGLMVWCFTMVESKQ